MARRVAVPVLDHLQRGQNFGAEHVLAGGQQGLGAEHLEGIIGHLRRAEARFAAPDRQHDPPGTP